MKNKTKLIDYIKKDNWIRKNLKITDNFENFQIYKFKILYLFQNAKALECLNIRNQDEIVSKSIHGINTNVVKFVRAK